MNELQVFHYSQNEVRMVMQESGLWWVLADVCKVLGIKNSRDAVNRLDPDEKGVGEIDTPGGSQHMTIINESGLYSVILRSSKPEAKAFKRWITHEVLPSIRKTGGYGQGLSTDVLNQLVACTQVLTQSVQVLAQEVAVTKASQRTEQPLQLSFKEVQADASGFMDSMEIARVLNREHNVVLRSIRRVSDQARADGIPVETCFSIAYRRGRNNVRHRYYRVNEMGISLLCRSMKEQAAEKLRRAFVTAKAPEGTVNLFQEVYG